MTLASDVPGKNPFGLAGVDAPLYDGAVPPETAMGLVVHQEVAQIPIKAQRFGVVLSHLDELAFDV